MKQILIICTSILALLFASCNKDSTLISEPTDPVNLDEPQLEPHICLHYGIQYKVESMYMNFWTGSAGITSGWMDETSDWDPDEPGVYDPFFVKSTFRGGWTTSLMGDYCSLTHNKELYEQFCLAWGVRFDNNEVDAPALDNIPLTRQISGVLTNHDIIGMDLITERDFDEDHPAGSSLADITRVIYYSKEPLFKAFYDNQSKAFDSKAVDFVNDVQNAITMKDIDASTLPRIDNRLGISIKKNPKQAGTYVFRQYIYLADGRKIETRFKRVWLEEHLSLDPLTPNPVSYF